MQPFGFILRRKVNHKCGESFRHMLAVLMYFFFPVELAQDSGIASVVYKCRHAAIVKTSSKFFSFSDLLDRPTAGNPIGPSLSDRPAGTLVL